MNPAFVEFGKGFRILSKGMLAMCLLLASATFAQDAVPVEILQRTLFIRIGNEAGTAFKVDYQGKIYFVTARHLAAGLAQTGATIQIWRNDGWTDFKTIRTLLPPSDAVDIAVLETDEKAPQPYEIGTDDTGGGVTMGQQVWFLGYPYGLGSHFPNGEFPFIKRGTMSAIDSTNPHAVVLYVDGFNNPGFSGGPILYWSFNDRKYKILGVVKGYKEDTAKVVVNGAQVDTNILVNSGILLGYSIKHVAEAIENGDKKSPDTH